ncbi:MAG: hypothetical protein FD166_3326 [Bacteroidetes bacterium]|nr:MAG: hypothetical protein FD166_3326 [Bacteroidota bacterium]
MNLTGVQLVHRYLVNGKTTAKITSQGSFLDALK